MKESDLKRVPENPSIVSCDAPDGRTVAIGKMPFTHVDLRRSMVSERIGWAWEVQDFVSEQAITKNGFRTRKAAFADVQLWIAANPKGKFHE